jgi:DNA-directed RNA polymerase specialized sigma24 family protein
MVTMVSRSRVGPAPTDGELACAARAGDVASLGVLLERYRAPLHGAALRLLEHAKADDAVQETFVIALRRIGDVHDPEAIGGWLHAVLRNVCLMSARRQRAVEVRETRNRARGPNGEPTLRIYQQLLRRRRREEYRERVNDARHVSGCDWFGPP